ncbi:MAG: MBL fold metallo-hydrolase [Clostridia bacterium]|nr:MBL fold metallo-hydrolase [Clostridia bacterium]
MLEVYFCNVGDGDAILLTEHLPDGRDYNVMVDAGRACLEPAEGSLRKEAVYYLMKRKIQHLDLMILTHLHIDHMGGVPRVLKTVRTDRLCVLTVPPQNAHPILPSFRSTEKKVNGLIQALNLYRELIEEAESLGCRIETAASGTVSLTDRLSMTTYLPDQGVMRRQKNVFDALYLQNETDHDTCYRAASERNLSSLMSLFAYAGRNILLTGDRYAADWENIPVPVCDIVKLPHHGDPKSMTEPLIRKLSPQYAVISCQNDPAAKKDRPNAEIVSMMQKYVPHILCTENKPLPGMEAATHNGILFRIEENGTMHCSME